MHEMQRSSSKVWSRQGLWQGTRVWSFHICSNLQPLTVPTLFTRPNLHGLIGAGDGLPVLHPVAARVGRTLGVAAEPRKQLAFCCVRVPLHDPHAVRCTAHLRTRRTASAMAPAASLIWRRDQGADSGLVPTETLYSLQGWE